MNQNFLILFNNVKDINNSSAIQSAFDKAKSYFIAMHYDPKKVKISSQYMTDQDIRKTVRKVIDKGYQVYIYGIFDEKSLKDGSVAVYYTDFGEEFNETKKFRQSIRTDQLPGLGLYANLLLGDVEWIEFEESTECEPDKIAHY